MMKVEILSNKNERRLAEYVNTFIAAHDVTNIKFQVAVGYHNNPTYTAMIVYEEREEGHV